MDASVAYDLRPFFLGRWDLMTPQHWGVIAGVTVYTVTVSVVVLLMIFGGTFTRIREEDQAFKVKGIAAFSNPFQRALLYDDLVAASESLPRKPIMPEVVVPDLKHSKPVAAILGNTVHLRPYDSALHLDALFNISNGAAIYAYGPYDPDESIYRFLDSGPFETAAGLASSSLLADIPDGLRLVIVDNTTGYVVGMVSLRDNLPSSLRIRVSDVWLTPAFQRSHVHTDTFITLLAYLFKLNYRRVEFQCDVLDGRTRRSVERVGFTFEGVMRKQRIIRGSNQDTALYSITNNEWRDGLRESLESKLRLPQGISAPTRRPAVVGETNK
jgi:RimJ/RimL family protein N-acetyltransferase